MPASNGGGEPLTRRHRFARCEPVHRLSEEANPRGRRPPVRHRACHSSSAIAKFIGPIRGCPLFSADPMALQRQMWWGRELAETSRPHRGQCPSRLLPRRARRVGINRSRRGAWINSCTTPANSLSARRAGISPSWLRRQCRPAWSRPVRCLPVRCLPVRCLPAWCLPAWSPPCRAGRRGALLELGEEVFQGPGRRAHRLDVDPRSGHVSGAVLAGRGPFADEPDGVLGGEALPVLAHLAGGADLRRIPLRRPRRTSG